jgi:hypothetical protein
MGVIRSVIFYLHIAGGFAKQVALTILGGATWLLC